MTDETKDLTEQDMIARLRARYQPPAYALFEHVRDATGYAASRTADAIVMGLWPSRGLVLEGFEIKCYRGDWLREVKAPEKAEVVLSYCDLIWVVTSQPGMVKDGELPPSWGLIEPNGTGLRVKVQAPIRPESERKPVGRHFLAALMRNAHTWLEHELANSDRTKKAREEGIAHGQSASRYQIERLTSDVAELTSRWQRFTEASGVEIGKWDSVERIGEAVRMVLASGHIDIRKRLEQARNDIDRVLGKLDGQGGTDGETSKGGGV